MNPKFEAMRGQVQLMRDARAQAAKLPENQMQLTEGFTVHKSVADLMKHLHNIPNQNQ
jgi:hypothetical protein